MKLFYKNGLTTRKISEIIEKMYRQHYSAQNVTNISESITKELELFNNKITVKSIILY
ncbi:transposase [Peptoniphilus olsenii]|uniref:transposase n=1 Tax=Peptoniphilus olsenii TaxID=411570 RepID=UPI003396622A